MRLKIEGIFWLINKIKKRMRFLKGRIAQSWNLLQIIKEYYDLFLELFLQCTIYIYIYHNLYLIKST